MALTRYIKLNDTKCHVFGMNDVMSLHPLRVMGDVSFRVFRETTRTEIAYTRHRF